MGKAVLKIRHEVFNHLWTVKPELAAELTRLDWDTGRDEKNVMALFGPLMEVQDAQALQNQLKAVGAPSLVREVRP